MTSDEKILHLVERINKINSGEEKVDEDVQCMLTIAFLRAWLEITGKEVNEGMLFTLFNGFGTTFFKEGLKFEIKDKSVNLLNEKEKEKEFIYSFLCKPIDVDANTCRIRTNKVEGFFSIFASRGQESKSFDYLRFINRKEESFPSIVSKFGDDGIEEERTVTLKVGNNKYLNCGYDQEVSYSREGIFLEKNIKLLPKGYLDDFRRDIMRRYSENIKFVIEPERIVDFIRLPELSMNEYGDGDFRFGRHGDFFDRNQQIVLFGSNIDEYYSNFDGYVRDLNSCLENEEENAKFKKYFPKLSEVAERRIKDIIANGLVDEESKSTGIHR